MKWRLLVPVLVIGLVGTVAFGAMHTDTHRWSWKMADLDRNRLDLAYYRGADTGPELANRVEHGDVLDATGTASYTQGGDAELIVRYRRDSSWLAGATPEWDYDCYRFTFQDGSSTRFRLTDCPRESRSVSEPSPG